MCWNFIEVYCIVFRLGLPRQFQRVISFSFLFFCVLPYMTCARNFFAISRIFVEVGLDKIMTFRSVRRLQSLSVKRFGVPHIIWHTVELPEPSMSESTNYHGNHRTVAAGTERSNRCHEITVRENTWKWTLSSGVPFFSNNRVTIVKVALTQKCEK